MMTRIESPSSLSFKQLGASRRESSGGSISSRDQGSCLWPRIGAFVGRLIESVGTADVCLALFTCCIICDVADIKSIQTTVMLDAS